MIGADIGIGHQVILVHICDGAEHQSHHHDRNGQTVDAGSAGLDGSDFVEARHDSECHERRHEAGHREHLRHHPGTPIFEVGERQGDRKTSLNQIIDELDELVNRKEGDERGHAAQKNDAESSEDIPVKRGAEDQNEREK